MFKSHSPRVPIPAASRFPPIERLEDRIAPANNVVTSFSGGTLTITTVDQLGETEVINNDNDQNFQLIGTAPGSVTVHKSGDTTINGGAADVLFTGVTNVVVDLKLGDDFLTGKNLDIPGDLTVKSGDGSNTLNMNSAGGPTKVRNLAFTNGDGVDNFAFLGGTAVVSGKLTLNLGTGGANLNIGFNAGDDVSIAGAVSITAGAGAENINFSGHDVLLNGGLTIKTGNGNLGVAVNTSDSFAVAKATAIVNGNGGSVFQVGNSSNHSTSFAGISIKSGTGSSTVKFASTVADAIHGDLTVTTGAGGHVFQALGVDFSVTGKVSIKNGNGDNVTTFSPSTTNTVGGAIAVSNGAGLDNFNVAGATVNFQDVKLSNGNGGSTTVLSGTNLSFASISVTSGDGLDGFTVSASNSFQVTKGGVTLKNGNGGSTTGINATNTAGIAGALSLVNGEGTDTLSIAGGNFSGLHAVTISNGAGGSTTTLNPTQMTMTGALTVTAGDGNDTVTVLNATVKGATKLTLGSNSDTVKIDNSTLEALSIDAGSGTDQVQIEKISNDGIGTLLKGAVSITLGVGDDTLNFGLDVNDFVTANAALKFDGGVGLDVFDQTGAANSLVVAPVLKAFEVQLP